MRRPSQRLAPRSWLRLPARTARLRLTLLYGALFLVSGAGLLAFIYLQVNRTSSGSAESASQRSGIGQNSVSGSTVSTTSDGSGSAHTRLNLPPDGQVGHQHASDLHNLLIWSAIGLALMTLVSIVLGYLIAGRVLRPVRTITSTARAISVRNLGERLALEGPDDEFKVLGDTLDDLLARLQAAFEGQRHFVANASHELRTPVTVERSLLQVALADPSPTVGSLLSTCQEALVASEQQQHLIEGLLTLASSESGLDHSEPVDLAELAAQVLLSPLSGIDRLDLDLKTGLAPAHVQGDPRLIERLIANLIENAVNHNRPDGHVQITTGTRHQRAFLTVTNTGPVIPAGDIGRLFQPFQRLDGVRTRHSNGHGLGLSIVQAIVTAHEATITTHAQPDGGLAIEVTFPRSERPREHAPANEPHAEQGNDPHANQGATHASKRR